MMVGEMGNNRISMYKRRGAGASDMEARRKRIAAERREERTQKRACAFAARRDVDDDDDEDGLGVKSREKKLEEFKKKKKKTEMSSKTNIPKKPFVMTKITYDDSYLYKPFESSEFKVPKGVVPVQCMQSQRALRSHTRNLQNKQTKTVQEAINDFTSAMNSAPKKNKIKVPEAINDFTSAMKSAPKKNKIKVPENQIDENISELLNRTFDGSHSPYPTKVSEKPSQKSHNYFEELGREGLPEIKKRSSVPETTNGFCSNSEKLSNHGNEENSSEHFSALHTQAVAELNRLSEYWTLQLAHELPDSVRDEINVAIGNAKLLISQKLQQFRDLISEHENMCNTTKLKVLSNDLDGFWFMVNNQVEGIYNKFKTLEVLKQNNWQELVEEIEPIKQLASKHLQKSKVSKAKGTSGLRSFLAHARNRARICNDENTNPSVDIFTRETVERSRPMSPVIMRVAAQAKFLGSPKIQTTSNGEARNTPHNFDVGSIPIVNPTSVRNPLRIIEAGNTIPIPRTPRSTIKTPARKIMSNTPGSTPVRRSMRILESMRQTPL